eukprot:GEMP01049463.1.p1 GENE.GEMP01049463.1~~GEMP01049463.1.p1  ORF type:complete len:453 (+),score=35.11 GEMP01049463.1:158-1516(+)
MDISDDDVFDVTADAKRQKRSNPCCGICVGFAMVIAGIGLLGWNERRTVCQMKAIYCAEDEAVHASCDKPPSDYENKLVFLSCPINPEDMKLYDATSTDSQNVGLTGIVSGVRGLCFEQRMEVFQCCEQKSQECVDFNNEGECTRARTKFKYKMEYIPNLLDSSHFGRDKHGNPSARAKHLRAQACGLEENPKLLPTKMFASTEPVTSLKMGRWVLDKPLLLRLIGACGKNPVPLNTNAFGRFNQGPQPPATLSKTTVTTNGDGKLHTCSAGEETIGCLKLSFATTSPKSVSLLYKVTGGGKFRHYRAPASWMCGGEELSHIVEGELEFDDVFMMFKDQESVFRFMLRVAGYLGIFGGLCLIFGPIEWLAEHVPFCGEFCGGVVGCMLHCIAATLAGAISLITIAIMYANYVCSQTGYISERQICIWNLPASHRVRCDQNNAESTIYFPYSC